MQSNVKKVHMQFDFLISFVSSLQAGREDVVAPEEEGLEEVVSVVDLVESGNLKDIVAVIERMYLLHS
jgi:hypothetical protein